MIPGLPEQVVKDIVARALAEDIGPGDITTLATVEAADRCQAEIVAKAEGVVAGMEVARAVFARLDPAASFGEQVRDGERVTSGQVAATLSGRTQAILIGERTALNFLQTLSATATVTRRYVSLVSGLTCRILDTRKTLPGLRRAQKYAVRCAGGTNHRMGLYDGILVKENHIMAAGSIAAAVAAARAAGASVPVEVEVETLDELRQALDAGADMALLDEFSLDDMRAAVSLSRSHPRGPIKLEASGNVSYETLRAIAETGVDFVSIGSLTKHVRAVDLSMRFEFDSPG